MQEKEHMGQKGKTRAGFVSSCLTCKMPALKGTVRTSL